MHKSIDLQFAEHIGEGDCMEYCSELNQRILRDMDDSVLALDNRGHIMYMNPQCQTLLGLKDDVLGRTYAEVFFDRQDTRNDKFHQFLVDAVLEKECTHTGTVSFTDAQNYTRHLRITSSFLKSDAGNEGNGVVLVLSDVTETEVLKKKRYDASVVFSCVIACVCLYLLLLATLDFLQIHVPTVNLSQILNGMVFCFGVIIYRKTDFSFEELGLKIQDYKNTFLPAIGISIALVAILMVVKLAVLRFAPGFFTAGSPFWNWNIGLYGWIGYIFSCIIQEFLARSMLYGSIRKMFDGKHAVLVAIILSTLLFGAVHLAHGFMYMTGAMILLGSLGGLYEKQRNIWGVAIIHYVMGEAATCLGFIV